MAVKKCSRFLSDSHRPSIATATSQVTAFTKGCALIHTE
jgi:hypothetical protein